MINLQTLNTSILNFVTGFIRFIEVTDVIDILIVSYIFYKIYNFAKDSRAGQVFNGVLILLIFTKVSEVLKLHSLYWIFYNILTVGPLAILIIFQPELRAGLEHIGRSKLNPIGKFSTTDEDVLNKNINEISNAIYLLAKDKIGALIIIERQTKLGEIINTGTILNAEISSQLLINIFIPNTPLHDGAVIIRDNLIRGASCFLPLTDRNDISKELGTRHRAGIGISEISDCISIMVSEETGAVSIAMNGTLSRDINEDEFKDILIKELNNNNNISNYENTKKSFFKKEGGQK